jgi:sugar (pentulose or hexulose) kinase
MPEGVACAVAATPAARGGERPAVATLHASSGMIASPTLVRLLADTLATPVEVATVPETASLGCAVLAAAAAGVHPTLSDALGAMTARTRVEPTREGVRIGEERYRKWRELYATLEQTTL